MSVDAVHFAQDADLDGVRNGPRRTTVGSIIDLLSHAHVDEVEALDGDLDREVLQVRLVEEPAQLDELDAGALAVLDRTLSHIADTYQFDVVVRRAIGRGIAALIVIAPATTRISITARALCRKGRLALVRMSPTQDVNAVLGAIARQVADELHVTVERTRRCLDAIDRLERRPIDPAALAHLASRILGREISVEPNDVAGPGTDGPDGDGRLAVPVVITEPDGDQFRTDRLTDEDANTLVRMVLWRLAAEASRSTLVEEQARRTNLLSVGEVLRQLVESDQSTRDDLSPLARKLGIPIDGWHVVVLIELDDVASGGDGVLAFSLRERLTRTALATISTSGTTWHAAQAPDALWLMHSSSMPPARDIGLRVHRQVTDVVEALRRIVPAVRCYAGIGGVRAGASGVAGSATEARLATAHARTLRKTNLPVSFDVIGLRTTIVEWYGSPTVQKSIDTLFAPMADMAPARRDSTIEILCTYLDLGGSVARTAVAMHLHRNAVRARIQRSLELVGVDIDDPDQRLFLHLACRARRPSTALRR